MKKISLILSNISLIRKPRWKLSRAKCLLTFVLILGMVISFCACGKSDYQKVRLNEVTLSVFYAPQYVALNLGFFEEEGLEIEITTGQGADKVMTSVLSGQADIGFAGPEAAIYVYNEGSEDYAKVFAQLTKRDGSFLVGRSAQDDFNWANLKDSLVIGGRKGGVPYMTLEYVLKKNGLNTEEDLVVDTSIQFALMAGAFTGGHGDYVTLFEPTASMLEKEGRGYVLASIGKESGEIPYTAYFAKKSYIEENKDLIQKFTNAVYKGQQWVQNHTPEEIAEVIKPSFPDADEDILIKVAQRYKENDAWCNEPIMKKEAFDLLQEVMKGAGELTQEVPFEELVDNEFAQKAIDAE